MTFQNNSIKTTTFLQLLIKEQADPTELNWVISQEKKIKNEYQKQSFYIAFGTAPRFISRRNLKNVDRDNFPTDQIGYEFEPEMWNLLQIVRTYFVLISVESNEENWKEDFLKLFETADIEEQVVLYRLLPLLPSPETMVERVREGLRTNITDVFDAIALNNPFPSHFLNRQGWNQMVLKAVFMQRPLYRILGADKRANPELARMLVDFAHERWAAHREVSPELWRFVSPFLGKDFFPEIKKVINGGSLENKAGLLACSSTNYEEARQLLTQYPEIESQIENDDLNWDLIGIELERKIKK